MPSLCEIEELCEKYSDDELIRLYLNGDEMAFDAIMNKYEKSVYSVAMNIVNDEWDAKDITQDVFLRVFWHIGSFRGESKFSSWIYSITRNLANDYLRRRARDSNNILVRIDDDDVELVDNDPSSDPQKYIDKTELEKCVMEAIDTLDDNLKTVIIMRDIEGCSYSDISEKLGIKTDAVKAGISTARDRVRRYLRQKNIV